MDKAREEFEKWVGIQNPKQELLNRSAIVTHRYANGAVDFAYEAWQHQQSIIDAQRAEIENLKLTLSVDANLLAHDWPIRSKEIKAMLEQPK